MKFLIFVSFAVLLAIVCNVEARRGGNFPPRSTGPTFPRQPSRDHRFRRETPEEPRGYVAVGRTQLLDNPDREPSYGIDNSDGIIADYRTSMPRWFRLRTYV